MFGFISKALRKVVGSKQDRDIKALMPIVDEINEEFEKLKSISHDDLRKKTTEFRTRISEYLAEIDGDIDSLQQQAQDTDDILRKQELFQEVDRLKEQRDEELEVVLQEILPQAFAVVKETARRFSSNETLRVTATDLDRAIAAKHDHVRIEGEEAIWSNTWAAGGTQVTWNMVHYDVQLIGGIVLHQGKIAEMATGEGKTLVATLPAYLNGLSGLGVHVITVNDYLAKRDAEWMTPLFNFLKLTIDCIDKYQPHSEGRKKAYASDIVYGTNNEFGFDYLRDNMVRHKEDVVQRKFHFTMIDEVDSVLIDDARTPLIISGPVPKDTQTEHYKSLKGRLEKLLDAQKRLVGELLSEAKRKIAEGNTKVEEGGGGLALFRAYRGLPGSRPLIKFLSQEGMQALLRKVEGHYMQEQSKNMFKADAPLFFTIEEKSRNVELTEKGAEFLGKYSEDANFFVMPDIGAIMSTIDTRSDLSNEEKVAHKDQALQEFSIKGERLHAINQLLKAYTLFSKGEDYEVLDGQVKIVDEQTGRIMEGRRYSDGLHQALEAKENVKIEKATQTYATVTLQNFFRMYHKMAGMTGTAETEAQEFWDIYKLEVIVIPTNKPIARDDKDDLVYKTDREKYAAIADEIQRLIQKGRPVLVGTTSVQNSELLSRLLTRMGITHNVLNAKQHAREADIVAEAGRPGQVTIATNMAGRGTDIKISEEVRKAGGLAIIGTERHDSRRVDRQLRGRAGRQGDVGSSQFYVSLDDKLMRIFGSERIAKVMDRMGHKEGDVIQHSWVSKSIERAQKKVEQNNFGVRKRLLEYDDVMNIQREAIYSKRNNALSGERLAIDLNEMFFSLVQELVFGAREINDFNQLKDDSIRYFGLEPDMTEDDFGLEDPNALAERLFDQVQEVYTRKTDLLKGTVMPLVQQIHQDPNVNYTKIAIPFTDGIRGMEVSVELEKAIQTEGKAIVDEIEKNISLALIDESWKEHLRVMDDLKESVQAASFEQKDPLVIYKMEAYNYFEAFLSDVNRDIASFLCRGSIPVRREEDVRQARTRQQVENEQVQTNIEAQKQQEEMQRRAAEQQQGRQEPPKPETFRRQEQKIGRNDPCPCGSGKKFKQCHGR